MKYQADHLVIGSGLAGLAFALKVADQSESKVLILSKASAEQTNTQWAQGGIAAVMASEDSFQSHIEDTLTAGAGLCRRSVVENIISQAPERILDLEKWGVRFDKDAKTGKTDLTKEGGHQYRRILHIEDHTGAEIHRALLNQCLKHPNIKILEHQFAVDLILNRKVAPHTMEPLTCIGAYVLDQKTGSIDAHIARSVILATGGAGKVYLYTSNWSGATGDGIGMAYRAGARVSNLEFMQFHPTCLYHPEARNFLISEALRGEGGELVTHDGVAFMKKYHHLGSLAPRDIVARSIDAEMKKSGHPCVYLKMDHLSREELLHRFPVIFKKCLDYGIDISKSPIPVVPAAHYLCGGVLTDVAGQTDIRGLWALGETACTGLHGANRLASNSLLECLAMAHNCVEALRKNPPSMPKHSIPEWIRPTQKDADEMIVIQHMWSEIRTLMWNYVGIVRSKKRLERALHRLDVILSEVKEYYSQMQMHPDILELRNIALVAHLSVRCALLRQESRGIHFNLDFPPSKESSIPPVDTILYR